MLERSKLLISDDQLNKFCNSNVLIVGIGGVGGACFEALVRMGIKNITVVDGDTFSTSNLNRQLLCTNSNIGHSKVKEALLRAKSINSDILVDCKEMFLNEANIDEIDYSKYDYIIDCCDTMTTKLLLIKKALEYNVKIISSMGTGNRLDPTKLEIMNKIKIIIKREYLTRVSKKSFLVMTILGPILMSLLIFTPFFLSTIEEDRLNIMVVDQTLNVSQNDSVYLFKNQFK